MTLLGGYDPYMMNMCGGYGYGCGGYGMSGENILGYGLGYFGVSLFSGLFDIGRTEIKESIAARRSGSVGGGGGGTKTTTTTVRDKATVQKELNTKAGLIDTQLKSAGITGDPYNVTVYEKLSVDPKFDIAITQASSNYDGKGTGSKEIALKTAEDAYNNPQTGYQALKNANEQILAKTDRTPDDNKNYTDNAKKMKELEDALTLARTEQEKAKTTYEKAVADKKAEEERLNGIKDTLNSLIAERDKLKEELENAPEVSNGVTSQTGLTDAGRQILNDADGTCGGRISKIKIDNDNNLVNAPADAKDTKKADLKRMINLYRNGNKAEKKAIQEWFKDNYKDNVRDKEKNSDIDKAAKLIIETNLG